MLTEGVKKINMHWYPVTGLLLLLCLLTQSEVHGQASSSVGYTIVVHERVSAGEFNDAEPMYAALPRDTDADFHSQDMDTESGSPEIKMYMEVAGESKLSPGNDLLNAGIEQAGLQQYLDPGKASSSISSETPENAARTPQSNADGSGAYRIVMEYN